MKKPPNKRVLNLNESDSLNRDHKRQLVSTDEKKTLFLDSGIDEDEFMEFLNKLNSSDSENSDLEGDNISDDEALSEEGWEDVALHNPGKNIRVSIKKQDLLTKEQKGKELLKQRIIEKKRQSNYIRKLKFSLHMMMIPFMFNVLKQRNNWCSDERLNRRLKRSVPKALRKRFDKWFDEESVEKEKNIRTLLLGLVMWFRANYQINSNGFRQNFSRLDILLENYDKSNEINDETEDVLAHPERYYGSRPSLDAHTYREDEKYEGTISHIRLMAKRKMANRDILTLFFFIILSNIIPGDKQLTLCFSFPLINFDISKDTIGNKGETQKRRRIADIVPNRFDSDLSKPYFWIELQFDKKFVFVIDPIVHVDKEAMVTKFQINEPIPLFQPQNKYNIDSKQLFFYVVGMEYKSNKFLDISPRYINNLCYRYFQLPHDSVITKSRNFIAFQHFRKWLNYYNYHREYRSEELLMKSIASRNYSLPTSLKELKESDNFIIENQLKRSQTLNFEDTTLGSLDLVTYRKLGNVVKLYWKSQVINLKSKQHWLILGRSIRKGETPKKLKRAKVRSYNKMCDNIIEIKELFSWEQTLPTLKLKSFLLTLIMLKGK